MYLIISMAIALSLDAFSVAISIGVNERSVIKHLVFAFLVGILHFLMPLFGYITNELLFSKYIVNGNNILGVILLFMGIQMLIEKKERNYKISKFSLIIMAISVSIDSFFSGIGLKMIKSVKPFNFLAFSAFSFFFSILGCQLGKIGKEYHDKLSTLLASIILIVLGVKYILL